MQQYKYMPEEFKGYNVFDEELAFFYKVLEQREKEPNHINHFEVMRAGRDIGLSLKHLVLNGRITQATANEIDEYIGGLIYD